MEPVSLLFSPGALLHTESGRRVLETTVLPRYIPGCRWFGGKARSPRKFQIVDCLPLGEDDVRSICIALVEVAYTDGNSEVYQLPLFAGPPAMLDGSGGEPPPPIASLYSGAVLQDALFTAEFRSLLFTLMSQHGGFSAEEGTFVGEAGALLSALPSPLVSRILRVEQSNSSIVFADSADRSCLFVKLFRKLESGVNPDVEITRFLSERQHFPHIPAYGGTIEYRGDAGDNRLVALALGMIENHGDAWSFTLKEVAAFFDEVERRGAARPDIALPALLEHGAEPPEMLELLGPFVSRAAQLGIRTGEMHLALAAGSDEPEFAPEALSAEDLRLLANSIRASSQRVWRLFGSHSQSSVLPLDLQGDLEQTEQRVIHIADALADEEIEAEKIRTHGDYHLGQVLETGDDFVIIDFEGEPLRSLSERRAKRSPLRDVAGMLRSFHYAAHAGLSARDHRTSLAPWAEVWSDVVGHIFLKAWRQTTAGAAFVPRDERQFAALLTAFLLEKVLYEVAYELNNRPDWVAIPLQGLTKIVER